MLLMWPALMLLYYRLARREEADMAREFGEAYADYKARTGMFFPKLPIGGSPKQIRHA
jgi:protein-S-isoprenylcysteine O-methyltransferase Ste14